VYFDVVQLPAAVVQIAISLVFRHNLAIYSLCPKISVTNRFFKNILTKSTHLSKNNYAPPPIFEYAL
jgi:hypothetical protein